MPTVLLDQRSFRHAEDGLEFLTSLLEAPAEHAIIGLDRHGTIVVWSEAARRRFGYTADQVVGVVNGSVLHIPEDRESGRVADILNHARQHGSWQGIVARVRQNGERFAASTLVTPRIDADGAEAGFVIVSSELSGERFRGLLEAAPDGLVIVDASGTIMLVNSQTERMFGWRREELIGKPIEMLVPERFRQHHVGLRMGYIAAPRVRALGNGLDIPGLHKEGHEIPVEISLSPLQTEEGLLVSAAIRDVSDRKRVERALQEKNVELERANRAKDRFLATMSHELRTPLNAVIGFTGTLLMQLPGPLTGDQEHQLRIVQSSARHLLSLINDLLDLAKIESGHVQMALEPVDCSAIVKEVSAEMRPQAEQKGLSFGVNVPESAVVVKADRRALRQVLLNLTHNAIKFTERGTVRVELARKAVDGRPAAELRIVDTGIGIKLEDYGKLFRPFSQLDVAGATMDGTGLGLLLSRRLTELMGGTLTFESEWGKGSIFTVHISE